MIPIIWRENKSISLHGNIMEGWLLQCLICLCLSPSPSYSGLWIFLNMPISLSSEPFDFPGTLFPWLHKPASFWFMKYQVVHVVVISQLSTLTTTTDLATPLPNWATVWFCCSPCDFVSTDPTSSSWSESQLAWANQCIQSP